MDARLFTSESVTEGHPDKVCDTCSDAVLDAIMEQDPYGRVACEVCTTTDFLLVMGEITTTAKVDYEKVVRDAVRKIGYTDPSIGFDADSCEVMIRLDTQSPDIAMGVDKALEYKTGEAADTEGDSLNEGAGDQGMMFGFACDETEDYMPLPIDLAHKLTRKLTQLRKEGVLSYLRPDGKTQVTVEYGEDGKVRRIDTVVCSTQHNESVTQEQLHRDIREKLFDAVLPRELVDDKTKYFINPTGQFIVGGPHGDSGLTGRKIIVDTYGGMGRHGGGAFSGKDCTKVDRSASYAARYIARNIVAAGLAHRCEIQISYAIGVAEPTSVMVDTFGTGKIDDRKLEEIVRKVFDLRPSGIIKMLDLRRPIYSRTTNYGHFGKSDQDLPWEKSDKAEELRREAGL